MAGAIVRIQAKSVLIPIFLLGTVGAAVAGDKVHREFAPWTKITLKARKTQYFLGENILLDYRIGATAKTPLLLIRLPASDRPIARSLSSTRMERKLPASTRPFHFTGQGGCTLRRGGSRRFTIPLSYYCRLEKPGKYRIRAAHNLHWTDRDGAVAKGDPRWAETVIEVRMPDDAQAKEVVEQMLQAKEDVTLYQRAYCTWDTADYADFACLRYPVYLPILEKMAADAHGDRRALLGIAHNPTPEATQALMRLLKPVANDRLKKILAALCDRLPEPKGGSRRDRLNPIQIEVAADGVIDDRDADPKLVKGSWRDDFSVPTCEFARKACSQATTPRSSSVRLTSWRPSARGRICLTSSPP